MDDRFNTAAGWVLFSGVIALGLSSIFTRVFHEERPEAMGYQIEVAEVSGGADKGPDLGKLLAAADAGNGEQEAIARCGTCHTFNPGGANGTGPNLAGVMGSAIAGKSGFGYSSGLAAKGGDWTWEAMNDWLINPKAFEPGTSMGFAGLKNDKTRADILVYLNSIGANLPLPEPAAEEPAAEEGAEGEAEADAAGEAEATEDAAAEVEEGGE